MEKNTVFICREDNADTCLNGVIYTPNESLGIVKLNNKRICNMFWTDFITIKTITREIYFDWYKEDCLPVKQQQNELF